MLAEKLVGGVLWLALGHLPLLPLSLISVLHSKVSTISTFPSDYFLPPSLLFFHHPYVPTESLLCVRHLEPTDA